MDEEQKVRLYYTIRFKEIPDEISKFLQKSLDLNRNVVTNLEIAKRKASASNVSFALNSIHEARLELIKIDQALEDSVGLLSGYGEYLESLQQTGLDSVADAVKNIDPQQQMETQLDLVPQREEEQDEQYEKKV